MRERILAYIRHRGISSYQFVKRAGLAHNFLLWQCKGISAKLMNKIAQAFPDLNMDWVATGVGDMLKADEETIPLSAHRSIVEAKEAEIAKLKKKIERLKSDRIR